MIEQYVLDLQEVDETQVAVVGGKGAHLGGLSRIEGIRVPAGFCVTTDAFRRIMAEAPSIDDRLDQLSRLNPDDREAIRTLSAQIRRTIEGIAIPDDLAAAITRALARLGEQAAYAVRSSATAEDLPTASFAGQQDTYLNVVGPAAILQHVSRCWASLFTERAVTYRQRNGIDHRTVHMAVVVQRMVFPQAAGILFTADPVTGNRKVATVDAGFGLGEALVSGLVNPDVFKVRRRRGRRQGDRRQAACRSRPAGRRYAGSGDRPAAAGAAGADGCAGRAARAARAADRSALRPPAGHRMVPGRRRLPDRAEPADHHAVPHPRDRRPGEPRLRLGRPRADDDRPHEAPGALRVAADGHGADARGRREAVRRRHPAPGLAREPRRPPGRHGERRSADQGRAGDRPRPRRLRPVAPGRGSRRAAGRRRARPDRDRSGHRHRADRAQPGVHRRPASATSGRRPDRRCSTSCWRPSRSTSGSSAIR